MRKWVFPIVRIVLVAVIAVALVKVAFFPDSVETTDPAVPTGQITEPRYPVSLGTITNDVTIKATVSADPAVPIKATAVGTVDDVFIPQGNAVNAGDVIFDIKVPIERDPKASTAEDGTPLPPVFRFEKVLAPASGVVSALTVIHGQSLAIGDVAGQVAPPSFSVSGSLSPEQQYRLMNQPTDALVTIAGGPAPFTCTGLTITTPLPGADTAKTDGSTPGSSGGGTAGGTTTTVRCPIPAEVTVFSGLAAELTIAGGKVENVVVVPTTAVKGAAQTGTVWVSTADGGTEERSVSLGLSDGRSIQVTAGLAEGEEILEFAPGAAPPAGGDPNNCVPMSDGGMVCGGL
jgi:macrolide-specific efflux system membrane fusion protein